MAHGPWDALSLGVEVLVQQVAVRISVVKQVQSRVVLVQTVGRDIHGMDLDGWHVLGHKIPQLLQAR